MSIRIAFKALALISLLSSCTTPLTVDKEQETAKILELHNLQRSYHFDKMPEPLASLLSEHHISVNRGEIKRPTKASNIERFGNYFNAVEFEKWDDIQPPVIRFSDDYSMAYTVVNKEVTVRYQNEESDTIRSTTEFAWVAIYRKRNDEWLIDCVASTNKPDVEAVLTDSSK